MIAKPGRHGHWIAISHHYLDCIHVKVRDAGVCVIKAVYLALGVNLNGEKELLEFGLPKPRGQILARCCDWTQKSWCAGYFHRLCDGLKGFPEAIEAFTPKLLSSLYRASDTLQPEFCKLETAQGGRYWSACHIYCHHNSGGRKTFDGIMMKNGVRITSIVSLAAQLGAYYPFFSYPQKSDASSIHQCDWVG